MGETFVIHVNCSKILVDDEAQYTMYIDTSKTSIVYELVEWIRWIFSVEDCVYLVHENSVIHELEDIRLLSKLNTFEIKPCGRPHCIHKNMYRNLLNKFNLFVSWNEMKVHKKFIEKINQMDQSLIKKSNSTDNFTLLSSKIHQNSIDCATTKTEKKKDGSINFKFSVSDNHLSNSSMEDSPINKKRALASSLESKAETNGKSIPKINCSDGNLNPKSKILKHSESSASCSNDIGDLLTQHLTSTIAEQMDCYSAKSPSKNNSEFEELSSKNPAKPKCEKKVKIKNKHIRPFSVGEILANIREDFKIATCESNTSVTFPVSEKRNFDDKINTVEDFLLNEEKIMKAKKRQRTRKKKKKSNNQNSENENFISSCIESTDIVSNYSYPKPQDISKPNHIRFDVDEEDNLMSNEVVNVMKMQNENKCEIVQEKMEVCNFFEAESEKSVLVMNSDWQNVSDSQLVDSELSPEKKMSHSSVVDNQTQKEEKLIDLDDQAYDLNTANSVNGGPDIKNYNSAFNILLSLKEKCKNSLVIERFE